MSDRIHKALAELVACQDLEAEIDRLAQEKCDDGAGDFRYRKLGYDYSRRQPLAWAEARAALDEGAGSSPPFVHPSESNSAAVLRGLVSEIVRLRWRDSSDVGYDEGRWGELCDSAALDIAYRTLGIAGEAAVAATNIITQDDFDKAYPPLPAEPTENG